MIKKIAFFSLGFIAAAILILGFSKNKEDHSHHHHHEHEHDHEHDLVEMDEQKADLHQITVKKSGPGTVKTTFTTRGKVILHPDRQASILPKVSGIVKEVRVNRGDYVRPGDIVAVIESKEIAEAKSQYFASFEREKLAETAFERDTRLYDKSISSEEDYLNSKHALQEAKINLRLARQKLFGYGLSDNEITSLASKNDENLGLYEIRSPIKGTVVNRNITYGEYLSETTPIFEIADLSRLLVELGVYPKDLGKVQEGQIAEIECTRSKLSVMGMIIYVSPLIEDDTITAKAFTEIDNKEKQWKPGTFVKVTVNADLQNFPVVVAKESIQYMEGEPVIFVQTASGFLKRNVEIGRSDDQNIEITNGLDTDTEYAASNVFLLKADLGKDTLEHEH